MSLSRTVRGNINQLGGASLAVLAVSLLLLAWPEGTPRARGALETGAETGGDRPYDVLRDPPTRKPQIVPLVHKNELYIAWHTWSGKRSGDKVVVCKVDTGSLGQGQLTRVREVASAGTLVGFTVDATGTDLVLTAKAEDLPNHPEGNFVKEVHGTWRKDVITMYAGGRGTDINNDKFTRVPFYGLTNAGSGRLAAGPTHLAAVFARRHYTPNDKLIHQEANALLVSRNPSAVVVKAENTVSHSFDQRLIFDGKDFVALHQADGYPHAGLLIEKIRTKPGVRPPVVRVAAYTCPTFGNSVYFELGGLAAEPDGYPVLFTATRNTEPVNAENQRAMHNKAWDLALVYVLRDFDLRPRPANPYDVITWGVLARGYAPDQEFKVDNFVFNPSTLRYDKPEPRTIKRRVLWLTAYDAATRATNARFVKIGPGRYLALWEEHTVMGRWWQHSATRALALTGSGPSSNKSITKGRQATLKGVRLPPGDDAVAVTIDGVSCAAWVTAGATPRQLLVHTLDGDLTHKSYPLKLP
jgi:hypothetical protein